MLINATNPTTGGRIPPTLLDVYVRYKQGTRAIIAWLTNHAMHKSRRRTTVTVRDLLGFAEIVQTKAIVMPALIDFHFRETIAARTQLSKFFRSKATPGIQDPETANHDFFTTSLNKMYMDLCGCCAKPQETYKGPCRDRPSEQSKTVSPNRFTVLKVGSIDGGCPSTEKLPNSSCDECEREKMTAVPSPKNAPRLVDDDLADAFELRKDIQEMSDSLRTVRGVWERAAQGETPLVVAAFITNTAFAAFEGVEQRLHVLCEGSNPETLQKKFTQMQEDLEASEDAEVNMEMRKSGQIEALQQPWKTLLQFKRSCRAAHDAGEIITAQPSSQISLQKDPLSESRDHESLVMMVRNIGHHVRVAQPPNSIVRMGSPVYPDLGYFVTHKENDTNGLRCSYGLQILLETFKSYLLVSQPPYPPPNCRLQALKFAQEAIPSVQAVLEDSTMPCRCYQTLAFHLENMHLDLKAFLQDKIFDLYFQSPWVSGSHMLEMLERLFYYGLRLFSYRHYVASVVHVYNVLRNFTEFQSLPLLEELCNVFEQILFPGGRPVRNFKACCVRYMGGRLRFDPHTSDHKSGFHHISIPAHTAKATAGFGLRKEEKDSRFEYRKISLFHHIKERGYHLDDTLWGEVHNITNLCQGRLPERSAKQRSCSQDDHSEDGTQNRLLLLRQAVLTEFDGPFPIAKVNFFQVYLACVRIVSIISDKAHGADGHGLNCVCFLDAALSAADRYKDNEHKMQPFGCKELVETCKNAMNTVLGGRGLDEFLWKSV